MKITFLNTAAWIGLVAFVALLPGVPGNRSASANPPTSFRSFHPPSNHANHFRLAHHRSAAGRIARRYRLDGFVVLGAATLPEFEGADEDRVAPFIVGRLTAPSGRNLQIAGLSGQLDLVDDPTWRAGPSFSVTLPRLEDDDSTVVSLVPEIDLAFQAGGFVGWELPTTEWFPEGKLSGSIAANHDLSGVHNGLLATGRIEHFAALHRMFRLGIGGTTTFASGEYMDRYFSIPADVAASSGLPAFDAEAGFKDIGVDVFGILSMSERAGVFARVGYTRLLGDAADTPIVDEFGDADQAFVGVGLFWQF